MSTVRSAKARTLPSTNEHWFSYRDACILVRETLPASSETKAPQTLFFLHGRYDHSGIWSQVGEALAGRFRCLFVDFPGFGRSFCATERGWALLEMAELIEKILSRMVPDPFELVLVGQDVGGSVALLCALGSIPNLKGIVLINSTSLFNAPTHLKTGPFGWTAKRRLRKQIHRLQDLEFYRELLKSPWFSRGSRSTLIQAHRALEFSWPRHFERMYWKKKTTELSHPVLLLWGTLDELNPVDHALELFRSFPSVDYFQHTECGHWPHLERPDWVSGKIREFVFRLQEVPRIAV